MDFWWMSCAVVIVFTCKAGHAQLNVCGTTSRNTKIVGGQAAVPGSWPWQVSLHGANRLHFCGGSLINQDWVLTSAHCFSSPSLDGLLVYLGQQYQLSINFHAVSRSISQMICHPEFNRANHDNDICLLQLSSSVIFTDYIRPVCLAAANSTYYSGTTSWVTGWGYIKASVPLPYPQMLQEVNVPVIGNMQCSCLYAGVYLITKNMLCAGLLAGGMDSCQGDSGGPMVIKQGQVWIQAGVVSFGADCGKAHSPGVYARVSQYQDWINSQITINPPGFITFSSSGNDSDLSVICETRSRGNKVLLSLAPLLLSLSLFSLWLH